MGYKINTTWRKFHESDIKKLNEILDSEYMNDLKIGHEINIMRNFNKAFDEEVSAFDFDIVLKFMKDNDWTWSNGSKEEIPTKEQMIDSMRERLNHGLYEIIKRGKTEYGSFSGGIVFEMSMIGNKCFVEIYFDIAHFVK